MNALCGERWLSLSPYLDRALDLATDERAGWLAALREEAPELAEELAALLGEHEALARESFLESGPATLLMPQAFAGETVGAYRLISPLGSGGMGSVWLADRIDGRFEGKAAVKLLNAALTGPAGKARFKREGTILARLTHPHIAHLIDAGVTPSGQPFLVLEYVEGERIDRYCDSSSLSVEARLRLFLDVLAAVAHAHANLIVHRDLKPSNVLVTRDGTVKLLDFGIAKLLGEETAGAEVTELTREGGGALTPEYAAPEQVVGAPITTATDIYALGVLLFVLLSGQHPAGDRARSPGTLIHAIVDTQPPALSEVAISNKNLARQTLADNAAKRGTTADGLGRRLRGDLDNIVARALKKDPRERYPSVTALGEDVQRHLENRPVSARPDSFAYRAQKFVRRNRLAVALASISVVAVAAGAWGTATQAHRALREAQIAAEQRDFALRQLSRAEAVNDLNSYLLSDAAPSGKPFTVGELLARAEQVIERQYAKDDANRVAMLISIGHQYQVLEQQDKARRVLNRAFDLSHSLSDVSLRAQASCAWAKAMADSSDFANDYAKSRELIEEELAKLPNLPQYMVYRVDCLSLATMLAREKGDAAHAVASAEAADRELRKMPAVSPPREVRASIDLAESYRAAGRYRDAIFVNEQAMARLKALGREDTETAGTVLNNWALTLDFMGQPASALALYERAIRLSSSQGAESPASPTVLNNLARAMLDLDRDLEAAKLGEKARAIARRTGNDTAYNRSLLTLAAAYRELGELDRAAAMVDEVEPLLMKALPAGHYAFGSVAAERGLIARSRGDPVTALNYFDRAVAITSAATEHSSVPLRSLIERSDLKLALGRYEEAATDATHALHLATSAIEPGTRSSRVGLAWLALARARVKQGDADNARAAFASAVEHLALTLSEDHPSTKEARAAVAQTKEASSSALAPH